MDNRFLARSEEWMKNYVDDDLTDFLTALVRRPGDVRGYKGWMFIRSSP